MSKISIMKKIICRFNLKKSRKGNRGLGLISSRAGLLRG
jgi:hypothetical protein